uniref:C2H2-type domain-containing protein n=1 Tax=Trichogramma kaykai TaxID=54128 RepID=A0ABD2WTQ1_9HYME
MTAIESLLLQGRSDCPKCHRTFSQSYSMYRHYRYECGDAPPRYQCPYCAYCSKWTHSIYNHVRKKHQGCEVKLNKRY